MQKSRHMRPFTFLSPKYIPLHHQNHFTEMHRPDTQHLSLLSPRSLSNVSHTPSRMRSQCDSLVSHGQKLSPLPLLQCPERRNSMAKHGELCTKECSQRGLETSWEPSAWRLHSQGLGLLPCSGSEYWGQQTMTPDTASIATAALSTMTAHTFQAADTVDMQTDSDMETATPSSKKEFCLWGLQRSGHIPHNKILSSRSIPLPPLLINYAAALSWGLRPELSLWTPI